MKCKDPIIKIKIVKEQTPEICLEAVKTEWICFTICQKNRHQRFVSEAVKNKPLTLRYVKEQTEEICWVYIKKNGCALSNVREKTLKMLH